MSNPFDARCESRSTSECRQKQGAQQYGGFWVSSMPAVEPREPEIQFWRALVLACSRSTFEDRCERCQARQTMRNPGNIRKRLASGQYHFSAVEKRAEAIGPENRTNRILRGLPAPFSTASLALFVSLQTHLAFDIVTIRRR